MQKTTAIHTKKIKTLGVFPGVFLFLAWCIFPLCPINAKAQAPLPAFAKGQNIIPCPNLSAARQKEELLLSRFTTYFDGENLPRCHNIRLACQKINGCKIEGGQEFSFNLRVGARTKERGFLDANVILEGQFVPGTGGGVCQVSTTLFNAALLAGMGMVESHAHSLQVGYVSPSLDAMVSSYSDLRFVNPYPTPVMLYMRANKNSVTAEIYGKNYGYTFETESICLLTLPPPPPQIIEGEEDRILRSGKNGLKSESYLTCYRHGKRIKSVRIRRDTYAFVQGIEQKKPAVEENPFFGQNQQSSQEQNPIEKGNSSGKVTQNN